MKPIADMSRAELAACVQSHLRHHGIDAVLSGGSCVAIYGHGQYVTQDLDLVPLSGIAPGRTRIRRLMAELGFSEHDRHFMHPEIDLVVDFPAGPPAIGEERVEAIYEIQLETGSLKILSPTDCVKDRLTWYYHDQDLECLRQAVLVARCQSIDLIEIERWSRAEGCHDQFRRIRAQLAAPGES